MAGPEVVLLAVTGMSTAVLTETLWALASGEWRAAVETVSARSAEWRRDFMVV
jgi:CRISPR-associated protein (TIGR02584 family)